MLRSLLGASGSKRIANTIELISSRRRLRNAVSAAAGGAAMLMASGVSADTLAQPRDTSLERTAHAYVLFREDVEALEKAPFKDAETTREAHRRLSSHDPKDLSAGWVALAALVAAETPEFAESLQEEIKEKRRRRRKELGGRDAFFAKLSADPTYARSLDGAQQAMERVMNMTARDSARITALGEAFKTQAYAMQKTRWGKARIASSKNRINDADGYKSARNPGQTPAVPGEEADGVVTPSLAAVHQNWSGEWGAAGPAAVPGEKNADAIMDRILNLAARYSVGGLNEKMVSVYARNDRSRNCLDMAELTLRQCIAATRASYEEAFCLGEHGLNDVAQCTSWIVGGGAS